MENTIVNYHATFSKTSGISEAARANFTALKSSRFTVNQINYIENKRQLIREHNNVLIDIDQKTINIYHININDIPSYILNNKIRTLPNTYNIAYWAWEFNKLPEEFVSLISLFDEIWVPSSFCQNIFTSYSFKPVVKIPHLIESIEIEESKPKIELQNKFVFLSIFDSLSTPERKNTDGLIQCFLDTFSTNPDVVLILKTVNLEKNKRLYKKLTEKANHHNSIILINENYTKKEIIQLIDSCHSYVSLHRSEGFGLTLAEAMLRNKIVIGTGYSGNLEFMNAQNSFLVPYQLITKDEDAGFIKKGYQYAEPDIDNSKKILKFVYANYNNLEDIKLNAKQSIENSFSKKAIGDLMNSRLAKISSFMKERSNVNLAKNSELITENIRLKHDIKKYEGNIIIKFKTILKSKTQKMVAYLFFIF
ncbi:glycosyltransferase [Flavobacterium sp. FZUC8N2.13]|uniref:Glycosyltransferase n=1 Tax=Flavobacterium zubiriense TaxID=3138075 RepID=A0ABV4TDS6_9FLAO